MEIKTSQNKTYPVKWIDTSILNEAALALQMTDTRSLPEIAAEFDGLTEIVRKDENQGDKTFPGFSVLVGIKRIGNDVLIQMEATA
jgi:hypothetical protein